MQGYKEAKTFRDRFGVGLKVGSGDRFASRVGSRKKVPSAPNDAIGHIAAHNWVCQSASVQK
eukprot:5068965-Pyramimonas_sp.AAC.1